MEKILPVSILPNIYSYTHTAYMHSILECDEYKKEHLFEGNIQNYKKMEWEEHSNNVEIGTDENDEKFIVSGNPYKTGRTYTVSRCCMNKDEITLKIDYFGVTNLAFINLFLSDEDERKALETRKNIFVFYINRKLSLFYNINDCCHSLNGNYSGFELPIYIKLSVEDSNICLHARKNRENWVLIEKMSIDQLPFTVKRIGLHVDMGENLYYNWLFMNYIQLRYTDISIEGIIHLDYDMYPMKNYQYDFVNYFLDIFKNTYKEVKLFYKGIENYIKYYVSQNQYIEVLLDEFYVQNRRAYNQCHYQHSNLIFGYSDREQVYYILGYNNKLAIAKISYSVFDIAIVKEGILKRYMYNCNNEDIEFSLDFMNEKMKEYSCGMNSSFMRCDQFPIHKDLYGFSIFDTLRKSEHLFKDFRIAYLILERNLLMRKRVEFIYYRNLISKIEYILLFNEIGEIINVSTLLLNLVIKYKFISSHNLKTKILKKLDYLIQLEEKFYQGFPIHTKLQTYEK
ncbi:MAG TPA: hypothetical protein VJ083_07120 [Sedimentibacter sp.]|nr:hypothetical protein [Sedimentibacter sp.]